MAAFNINDVVKVKLTPAGIQCLDEWADQEAARSIAAYGTDYHTTRFTEWATVRKTIPADGWKEFQIWEMMQIFGPRTSMASPQFFERNVIQLVESAQSVAA
jgi:hypothetical protein